MKAKYVLIGFIATGIVLLTLLVIVFRINKIDYEKEQREIYLEDVRALANNYEQLYNLCETKYQKGIDGNYDQAYEIKGKMIQLEKEVEGIQKKYGKS